MISFLLLVIAILVVSNIITFGYSLLAMKQLQKDLAKARGAESTLTESLKEW